MTVTTTVVRSPFAPHRSLHSLHSHLHSHLRRRRSALALAALIAVAAPIAVTGAVFAVPSVANAATIGPGYEWNGQANSHLGGYLDPDGSVSYCINAGEPSAVGGVTTDAGILSQVNGLGEDAMVRLNVVLSRFGNTADNNSAAAVAMAVWSIAGNAAYQAEGGDNFVLGRAPASERGAIQALADQYRQVAASYTAPKTDVRLSLSIDATSDFTGFLDVTAAPQTASGTVTLQSGVFADTNSETRAGVANGAHLPIRGTPKTGEPYRITASTSDFTAPGEPSANVHVYATPGAQTLTASGTSTPAVFGATASDIRDRLVPAIRTVAQPLGTVGGTVIDTAFATNVPRSGEQLSWAGYLQPVGAAQPSCTAQELRHSSTKPLTITQDGAYSSEAFAVTEADIGTLLWIETAMIDGQIIAQGVCGAAPETSVITAAAVHLPVVSG